jgi:hypothetical protein
MAILMSIRQCARYIGIPYQTLNNYRLRMPNDIPYTEVGSAKLVDPELVRRMLLAEGYQFKQPGLDSLSGTVQDSDIYDDPQQMLADIENGKLQEGIQ